MANKDFNKMSADIAKGCRELGVLYRQSVKRNGKDIPTLEMISEQKKGLRRKANEFDTMAYQTYSEASGKSKIDAVNASIAQMESAHNKKLIIRTMHRM